MEELIKEYEELLKRTRENTINIVNKAHELDTIRATLMVNFGGGRTGEKINLHLKNEGTTLSMLMYVLEKLCEDKL